ncbi:MAG: DNA mismatch repair protein MutS [Stygiobacter sp.]|jgi:DNA mismatch repair ATPase MutS
MKAYLMFKNRDFDPQLLISRKINRVRSWKQDGLPDLKQLLPFNAEALIQDLGLDILFHAMAQSDTFLLEVVSLAVLDPISDIDIILYRQEILRDCLKHETIIKELYQLTIEAIKKERDNQWLGFYSKYPSSILHQSLNKITLFVEMLKKLKNIAVKYEEIFGSEGFKRFFRMLRQELNDEYLEKIDEYLKQLKFNDGVLISAELGRGNKGTNYILQKMPDDNRSWLKRLLSNKLKSFISSRKSFTYKLDPHDEAGARALSELRDQSINSVANALAQSADHISNFFQSLRTELAFYIGCLNLQETLNKMKLPFCFPVPTNHEERKLSFTGLCDICLALSKNSKVVSNNLNAVGKNLIVITGANTGGKSTFLRSIGIAQLMMQAGMFVPAASFVAETYMNIVTHFKREEDITMESGKLDEELHRMSEIVDKINSKSLVLFNESFSATNEREGSEIARQIVNALTESGIKVIFVTHLYEFAHSLYEKKNENAVFLRAERLEDGTRTFRIIAGKPLHTSYGEDLYFKIFNK